MQRGLLLPIVLFACACNQRDAAATREGHRGDDGAIGVNPPNRVAAVPDQQIGAVSEPRFFSSGQQNPELMAAIRSGVEREVAFAGHFSKAYVDCGTGCGSFWFVDRRNGAVLESPGEAPEGQMISDIVTRADSDVVTIIYGSRDGVAERCSTQSFRWSGREFERLSDLRPSSCPS